MSGGGARFPTFDAECRSAYKLYSLYIDGGRLMSNGGFGTLDA